MSETLEKEAELQVEPAERLADLKPVSDGLYLAPENKRKWAALSRGEKTLEDRKRIETRLSHRASQVVAYAIDGARIDDEGPAPASWNATHVRVARDARKPLKQRPYYLELAARASESFRKADSARDASPTLNASIIQIRVDQRVYPTKQVKE